MSDINDRTARTFEITAKNFEEGKAQAEAEYGKEGEVSCYLLEKEKKGFLGIGAAPAKIRVTVTPKLDVVGDVMRGGSDVKPDKGAKRGDQRERRDDRRDQRQKPQNNAKDRKTEAKEASKQQKNEAKETSKQQKTEAKETFKQQKDEAKENYKQQKNESKEDFKQQKKEAKDISKQQKESAPEAKDKKNAERENIVITQNEMDVALDFVNNLLRNMETEAKAVQAEPPEGAVFEGVYPRIEIVGENTGILIGHHGETMDAIQFLANLCVNRKTDVGGKEFVKIVVDIENYREKREETLRALARRMAAKAVKNKRNVVLEPMNPYERHIIHAELQGMENIGTHSVGSDENRKVVITYEGEDKIEHKSRNRRQKQKSGDGAQNRPARRNDAPKAPVRPVSEEESAAIKEAYEAYQEEKAGRERPRRATSIDEILNGDGGLF